MSRHGYYDDCGGWDLIRWRGVVASAIRGKRGQKLLREMRAALDAMPSKRLISGCLKDRNGDVCALGSVGKARGIPNLGQIDSGDPEQLAIMFDVAPCLIQEIEFINDEWGKAETPERRWEIVSEWVNSQLKKGGAK